MIALEPVVASVEIEALRASRDEWQARAEAAERSSAQKERLLHALTSAARAEGRMVVACAITCGPDKPLTLSLHSGEEDEADVLARFGRMVSSALRMLDATTRHADGIRRRRALEGEAE